MARRKGFEPLTPRFEVWCSIQLSYRRCGETWYAEERRPLAYRICSLITAKLPEFPAFT
jgi:hypothetical protein